MSYIKIQLMVSKIIKKLNFVSPITTKKAQLETFFIISILLIGLSLWVFFTDHVIPEDPYFYLVVSKNIVLNGHHSFNNIFSTNGFHPLWQYLLVLYDYCLNFIDSSWIHFSVHAVPLSFLLLCLSVKNLFKLKTQLKVSSSLFIIIPIIYSMFFSMLYSEAHLYLYILTILLCFISNSDFFKNKNILKLSTICTLLFLSRLDSIFIIISLFLWISCIHKKLIFTLKSGCLFTLLSLPYLIFNYSYFGSFFPISGYMKSSFPNIATAPSFFKLTPLPLFREYQVLLGLLPIILGVSIYFYNIYYKKITHQKQIHLIGIMSIGLLFHAFYHMLFSIGWVVSSNAR